MTHRSPDPGQALRLGPGPEFDRIRAIIERLDLQASGLGDDCVLLPAERGYLALSTDVSVEGIHFRLDWITLAEAGWRATAAALSDLAAEGAKAIGVLTAVTVPTAAPEAELLELMSGVGAAAASVGGTVLGGDLSSGPVWSISVTVVGDTTTPVRREGARPGNELWVSGVLGGSRAALEAWRRGEQPSAAARERYARPQPRIAAGRWLATNGAQAMIDLSDGIAGDAGHLAAGSGVALDVDLRDLPLAPGVQEEASRLRISPQQFAAEGGEDYELLVALPRGFNGADAFTRDLGLPLTRIGTIVEGQGTRFLYDGKSTVLTGFNHFG